MVNNNQQSKILSIDEQIKKLQEKKNREIAKLEKSTGKKFIETFKAQALPIDEIYKIIAEVKKLYDANKAIELNTADNISNDVK